VALLWKMIWNLGDPMSLRHSVSPLHTPVNPVISENDSEGLEQTRHVPDGSLILSCVTWLVHIREKTLTYVCSDSFICVTWLSHMNSTTDSYLRYDSCICGRAMDLEMRDFASFICVTWCTKMRWMTHSYVWCYSLMCS